LIGGNIFLIGFMGCGKSAVGREMAKMTGKRLIEMDDAIAEEEGMTIPEIFEKKGEPYFRDLETEFLRTIADAGDCIVSCGGGAAMREENVRLMKQSGIVVLLTADPETVYDRIHLGTGRPVLRGRMDVESICSLMERRRPFYEAAADRTVATDGRTVREVAERVISAGDPCEAKNHTKTSRIIPKDCRS